MKISLIKELKEYISEIDLLKAVIIKLNEMEENDCLSIIKQIKKAGDKSHEFCRLLVESTNLYITTSNARKLLNRFVKEEYEPIILELMSKLIKRRYSVDEIFEFIDLLKEYNLDEMVCAYLTDKKVLENLSIEEIKEMLTFWKDSNYSENVYKYMSNTELLQFYKVKDIKDIINELSELEFDIYSCSFLDDIISLCLPVEKVIQLLKLYVDKDYNSMIKDMLTNSIIARLDYDYIVYLVDKLEQSNNKDLYTLLTYRNFVGHFTFENIKKIVDKVEYLYFKREAIRCVIDIIIENNGQNDCLTDTILKRMEKVCAIPFGDNLSEITSMTDLDNLLNSIEADEGDIDLDNATDVYRYVRKPKNQDK